MLPPSIPIFPLTNAVLFPDVFLPLHVFEPRYRDLVADALGGDRMIGVVLLKPGHELEYEGHPAVYSIGCRGVITHAERLEDGRYNIILRGLEKFRILSEDHSRTYRVAHIEAIGETPDGSAREQLRQQRQRLDALLIPWLATADAEARIPDGMADDDLVNALSQYLGFEPVERQALLECRGLLERCQALMELLEIKLLAARHAWNTKGWLA